MRKQNVFLVSGRRCDGNGLPHGEVINSVVCATHGDKVRGLIAQTNPEFSVLSVVSLATLEETVKKMKETLAGTDQRWEVLIDPDFSGP